MLSTGAARCLNINPALKELAVYLLNGRQKDHVSFI